MRLLEAQTETIAQAMSTYYQSFVPGSSNIPLPSDLPFFEGECDGEESPELAGIPGRSARDVKGANGGEKDHGEVQSVGEEKAFGGGANGFQIQHEQNSHKDRSSDGEPGKLAGREQEASAYEVGTWVRVYTRSDQLSGRGTARRKRRDAPVGMTTKAKERKEKRVVTFDCKNPPLAESAKDGHHQVRLLRARENTKSAR